MTLNFSCHVFPIFCLLFVFQSPLICTFIQPWSFCHTSNAYFVVFDFSHLSRNAYPEWKPIWDILSLCFIAFEEVDKIQLQEHIPVRRVFIVHSALLLKQFQPVWWKNRMLLFSSMTNLVGHSFSLVGILFSTALTQFLLPYLGICHLPVHLPRQPPIKPKERVIFM